MEWFDEQISSRIKNDDRAVRKANIELSSIVMGHKILSSIPVERKETEDKANRAIADYYNVPSIEDLASREVNLTDGWYRECIGAILAHKPNGEAVALIPDKSNGYYCKDSQTDEKIRITKKSKFELKAKCFYKSLPPRPIGIKELIAFAMNNLSRHDIASYLIFVLLASVLGLFLPYINNEIFSHVIPDNSTTMLAGISFLFATVILATTLIGICQNLSIAKIQTKIYSTLSPAIYLRILSLPVTFFRGYTAGELSERSQAIYSLVEMMFGTILTSLIGLLFSFIYIFQIDMMIPSLMVPAIIITGALLTLSFITAYFSTIEARLKMKASAKLSGFLFSLINGIQKIKLTGAEKRIYAQWAQKYKEKAHCEYNPPLMLKMSGALNASLSLIGTIVFFYFAARSGVTPAHYMAFTVAFGLINNAVLSVGNIVSAIAHIRPTLEMCKPIMDTQPEVFEDMHRMYRLSGNIEVNNLSFRYDDNSPLVFENLSLKIKSGEYIGVVGKTGCGKSTLLRLLLGFEKAQKGAIYYDGFNIESIDLKSLRRNIGVVMQNSKLFSGNIFSNIAISAPGLTIDEAWEAARLADIDKDIEALPMGMFTAVNEGGGGFSGGQIQRLIIARAIASKPSILIFDEATSALDNITQKQVTESLDALKCTKIVIAHRLSTIRNCDRIILLQDGHIVEEGSYDNLMQRGGCFVDLVKRQM